MLLCFVGQHRQVSKLDKIDKFHSLSMRTTAAMFNANLIFISLLLSDSYDLCQSNISSPTVAPKTAVVKIRANVSFQCIVNLTDFPFWRFLNISNTQDVTILLKNGIIDRLKSRYRTNNSSGGPYVLIIDHIDHGHAGRYTCTGRDSVPIASAELTVIDSDPVCGTSTMENYTIWMWCEINSTGNLIPSMKWTKDNDAIVNSITQRRTAINGLTTTTSFVRLQLQSHNNDAIEGITVKCATSFIWKNGSREDIPHYEHVWNHTLTLPWKKYIQETFDGKLVCGLVAKVAITEGIIILLLIVALIATGLKANKATKEAKINASSTTSKPNSGSEVKTENKEREAKRKRHPRKRQTKEDEEHRTENVDAYESIGVRPAKSTQSETYCELNLPEEGKLQTKPPTSTVSKDKRGRSQAIGNYEMLASRPAAAMQTETYCELQIMEKSKRKEKKT